MGDITFDLSGGGAIDDLRAANRLHGAVTGLLLGGDGHEDITHEEKTKELINIINELLDVSSLVDDKPFMNWFVATLEDSGSFEKFTVKSFIGNIKAWHEVYLNELGSKLS